MRAGPDWAPALELVAAAAAHPGGSVAEIDPRYVDDPNGYVPTEAIVGSWVVAADGTPTGEFDENPRYGPAPADDFAKVTDESSWLGMLFADPAVMIRDVVTNMLCEQVAGSVVEWIKVTAPPQQLTTGRHDGDTTLTVTGVLIGVPVAFGVAGPQTPREILWGVLMYRRRGMDQPGTATSRFWLDLRLDLEQAGDLMEARMRER